MSIILTDRVREFVAHVQRLSEEKGYPPTYRELIVAMGVGAGSLNWIRQLWDRCETLGLAEVPHMPGASRIRVLTAEGRAVADAWRAEQADRLRFDGWEPATARTGSGAVWRGFFRPIGAAP